MLQSCELSSTAFSHQRMSEVKMRWQAYAPVQHVPGLFSSFILERCCCRALPTVSVKERLSWGVSGHCEVFGD